MIAQTPESSKMMETAREIIVRIFNDIQNIHSPQGGACFPSVYFCFFNYGTGMDPPFMHALFFRYPYQQLVTGIYGP